MKRILYILMITCTATGCQKEWLDKKPDQALAVPDNLRDLEGLLDNTNVFNMTFPYLGELGSDNYYLSTAAFTPRNQTEKNIYTWASVEDIYTGSIPLSWKQPYLRVFYANTILEQVELLPTDTSGRRERIKGSALFHRAFAFYDLAQLFALPYRESSAASDMGIQLRLSSDINLKPGRSTVAETYDRITSDIKQAIALLPALVARPTLVSKQAATALLARVYLTMEKYAEALDFADQTLQLQSQLLDYNLIDTTSFNKTFLKYNSEVIFHAQSDFSTMQPSFVGAGQIDSILYNSFQPDDLRRAVFFSNYNGRRVFSGQYSGIFYLFAGLATDEVFLIKAEAQARTGDTDGAMSTLNILLQSRWRNTIPYAPVTAANAQDALQIILTERRKELVCRDQRWTDLRRLNRDPAFQVTLTRLVNNQTITLPPNDNRYVYPIPVIELTLNNIQQNPR